MDPLQVIADHWCLSRRRACDVETARPGLRRGVAAALSSSPGCSAPHSLAVFQSLALRQGNMEPEKEPLNEDSSLSGTTSQVPCLFGRA